MTHRFSRGLMAGLALTAILAAPASAQSVRLLGDHRDWSSYASGDGPSAVCFMLSKPSDVSPTPDGYSQGYLYVSHRPSENVTYELNLVAGFTFAPDTTATLTVGGSTFPLFTERDAAWLENPAQSENLAGVIRAGSSLVIEGTSDKGIKIKETFSLSGATAASRSIDDAC